SCSPLRHSRHFTQPFGGLVRRVGMTIPSDDQPLPDDPAALRALVRELLDALAAERREGAALRTRLDQLLRRLYGPKSEKVTGAPVPTTEPSDDALSLNAAGTGASRKRGHGRK